MAELPAERNVDTGVGETLESVAQCLIARTSVAAEEAWQGTQTELEAIFASDVWGMNHSVNVYGQGAHANLYNVECQKDFRTWLSEQNVSIQDYGRAVGEVQYVAVQIYLKSLLAQARGNKGWRIRVLGFPALRVVALGLASHYQGTQNHNQMGHASARIRAQALEVLPPDLQPTLNEFRAATAEDWEERGLMSSPVLAIGDLDISSYDNQGAKLRMVRNTTVKKELATYFALKGMTIEDFRENGLEELIKLRHIASVLGEVGGKR